MRDKIALFCKVGVVIVCAMAFLSGRPPSTAQEQVQRTIPASPTLDTLALAQNYEEGDIRDLKMELAIQRQTLAAFDARQQAQAERQATLDTKMSGFLFVISLLASGGIVLQLRKKNAG